LKNLLARVRSGEISGLNVTIPHKQNVIPLLDELTPTATAVGAVNTIFLKNGKLAGDNTDAPGFLADLMRFMEERGARTGNWELGQDERKSQPIKRKSTIIHRKSALVLGAGGSARAVIYGLANDGWNIILSARCYEQAQTLIEQFSNLNSRLSFIEYRKTTLQSLTSSLSLIINTTPVGMVPNIEASPWPEGLPFPPNAAIYDLVYNPRETELVRDARAAGLPATTGLGMLVEQAALSFEIWTGCLPQLNALFKVVN
jgi:shikimate dehydrogenase